MAIGLLKSHSGRSLRALLAYGVATFLARMYAFVGIFLFSRLMSVHDYGLYVLAAGVGEFCDIISASWFRVGFTRFYHEGAVVVSGAPQRNLTPVYLQALKCCVVGIGMACVCALALVPGQWPIFWLITSLYVVGNGTVQMVLTTLRGEGRSLRYLGVESFRQLTNLSLGLMAAHFFHPTFATIGIAVFGSHALVGTCVLGVLWIRRTGRGDVSNRVPEMIRYSWPLILGAALTASISTADRYQLQWILGPGAVAIYSAAYAIGRQPIDILFSSINIKTFTELMRTYDEAGIAAASRLLGRQLTLLLGFALPGVVGVSILSSRIIHVLFDHRYWSQAPALVPIIAAAALISGYRAFGFDQVFHMLRKAMYTAFTAIPSLIMSFSIGFLLVIRFGIAGAAYGMLLGMIINLTLSAALVMRLMPIPISWIEISKVVASVSLMALTLTVVPWSHRVSAGWLAASVLAGIVSYGFSIVFLDCMGSRRHARTLIVAVQRQISSWRAAP